MDKNLNYNEFKKSNPEKILVATLNLLSIFAKEYTANNGDFKVPKENTEFNLNAPIEGPY